MQRKINGILLLDKSADISSNHALQQVKRLFHAKKAGHTGSLDPIATGMLPICFGEATKFSQFLLNSDKVYTVTAKLGETTNTGDIEGEIIERASIEHVTQPQIEQVMLSLLGEIDQVPPMYSAIKYNGKPLYKLARKGIEVERKSRKVNIFSLDLISFASGNITFTVHCSKGTYVRTLVEEIGRGLQCGAHVTALRRDSVSPYQQGPMYTIDCLNEIAAKDGDQGLLACLLPIESSVEIFPAVKLSTAAAFYLKMGQPVRATLPLDSTLVRLVSQDQRFLGMGEVMDDGRVKPHRLLAG